MNRMLVPIPVLVALLTALPPPAAAAQSKGPRLDSYGDPLPDGAIGRLGTARFRHAGKDLLGFTPDGKSLLFLGSGTLQVMDAVTGKETKSVVTGVAGPRTFRRAFEADSNFAISADTKVLAVVHFNPNNGETAVVVIETAGGKERKRFSNNELFKNLGNILDANLQLTEDGKFLLVSPGDGRRFGIPRPPPPPGGGGNPTPIVWVDTTTGARVHEATPGKGMRFGAARFNPDGKQVAVLEHDDANGNTRLRFFDAARGNETRSLDVQGGNTLSSLELRPDNKTLLAGSAQGVMRLYDYTADKQLKEIRGFDLAPGNAYALSRDGKNLFLAGVGKVHHWDVDSGKEVRQLDAPQLFGLGGGRGMMTGGLAVSADGTLLAVSGTQSAAVFDTATGKQKAGASGGSALIAIRFTPDGKGLFTNSNDYVVHQWEVASAKLVRALVTPDKLRRDRFDFDLAPYLGVVDFSSDGKLVAVSQGSVGVTIWETDTGKLVKRYAAEERARRDDFLQSVGFAFAPRGHVMALAYPTGAIKLTDVDADTVLQTWAWPTGTSRNAWIPSLAFSPDGKTLVGGGINGDFDRGPSAETMVVFWETTTGKERMRLRYDIKGLENDMQGEIAEFFLAFAQLPASLRFTADGKMLVIGNFTGMHLVNAANGKHVASYSSHMTLGRTATLSANGKHLFIGGADGLLRVLDAGTGRIVREVTAHAEPIWSLSLSPDGKTLASGSNDSTVLLWDVAELTKPRGPGEKIKITAAEMGRLWKDLGDGDAGKAFQAIGTLTEAQAEAVAFLKGQLKPVAPVDAKVLDNLMEDLNSDVYKVREKANLDLEKLGDLAGPILKLRLAGKPSLEMRQRIEKLLAKLNGPVTSPQVVQALRAIEALERIGTREALEALTALAKGAPGHRITEGAREAAERLERALKRP
jgi:WD40 repeat protein